MYAVKIYAVTALESSESTVKENLYNIEDLYVTETISHPTSLSSWSFMQYSQ